LSTNKKYALSRNKHNEAFYISKNTERRPGGGRPRKWNDLEECINQKIRYYWECGAPLTSEQLQGIIRQHIISNCDAAAVNTFVEGKPNTLHKFISRLLRRNQWSVRKISISQSVPVDWRLKAESNSERIRQKFKDENVDMVINADETFLLFHPFGEKLIAPTGIKRVGSAVQVDNEKWGATVMIACEFRTSSVLPPMVIFTGVYCAKLMTQWAKYSKGKSEMDFSSLYMSLSKPLLLLSFLAKVIFNESHWMTSNASIIYISYLASMFRGKTIGLIWDKHSSHYSADVMEFIERCNADKATETRFVMELVDEGLTPIIQVPDVAVNKVFKAAVKGKYHTYRSGLPIKIGEKVSVPRETMVQFILEAISDINNRNYDDPFIREGFRRCGLNPWSEKHSLDAFRDHLDKLEENDVLKTMLQNQKALSLT